MSGGLRPGPLRVDGIRAPVDDVGVEGVLHVRLRVRRAEEALDVRLVFGEQQFAVAVAVQRMLAVLRVAGDERGRARSGRDLRFRRRLPRPGVAKPQRRQEMEPAPLLSAIYDRERNQDVAWGRLRVFHEDVVIGIVGEDAGVEQFVFRVGLRAARAFCDEVCVRIGPLRILVEGLHIAVRRDVVEVEVVLLNVLAVVAFGPRQAEEALFEDRVFLVPKRGGEAEVLVRVADAEDAVFAPAVGARTRVVVREVRPGLAGRAVVLAHRAPLTGADVGAPLLPVRGPVGILHEPAVLCRVGSRARAAAQEGAYVHVIVRSPSGGQLLRRGGFSAAARRRL